MLALILFASAPFSFRSRVEDTCHFREHFSAHKLFLSQHSNLPISSPCFLYAISYTNRTSLVLFTRTMVTNC